MDFDALAYPDNIFVNDLELTALRNKNKITIPYTNNITVSIGETLLYKVGGIDEIELKVLDILSHKQPTMKMGTKHPHSMVLVVENMTTRKHKPAELAPIHIGSINGEQIQVGNNNIQNVNVTIQDLVEEIAKRDDTEAKGFLKSLLDNSTVGSIIGAGASAALSTLLLP